MHSSLAVAVLAASASATFTGGFGFGSVAPFQCPSNTRDRCSDRQVKGFDFADAPEGSLTTFSEFIFTGFTVTSTQTRLGRRTGSGKAIRGVCSGDKDKSPSFGHPSQDFSVDFIHVQPEFDGLFEFHYSMPDGSSCRHRSFCSAGGGGTRVPNNQCGGARNVTVILPPQPTTPPKPSCTVVVPTIGFSCAPSATAINNRPPPSNTVRTTLPPPAATTVTTRTSISAVVVPPSPSPIFVNNTVVSVSTRTVTTASELVLVTGTPVTTQTASPLTTSIPSNNNNNNTATDNTPLPCPGVVPACIATFSTLQGCAGNDDHQCYCRDTKSVQLMFECFFARGETAEIVVQATQFLQGICAAHIPENPAIVTGCTFTNFVTVTERVTALPVPSATVTFDAVQTPGQCTRQDQGCVTVQSTIRTTVTVPQIGFATSGSAVAAVPAPRITATNNGPQAEATIPVLGGVTTGTAAAVTTGFGVGTTSRATATGTAKPVATVAGAPGRVGGRGLVLGAALVGAIALL